MKDGTIVKRNGNLFIVKKDKSYHYYLATLMGNVRVTAWHRTPLHKIKECYTVVTEILTQDELEYMRNDIDITIRTLNALNKED